MRAVGGHSFIHDLINIAGGNLLYAQHPEGYFKPNFQDVAQQQPDIFLFFHEPEYRITPSQLVLERGWNPSIPTILSSVQCGENLIQDGPSFLDTADWLFQKLHDIYPLRCS